MGLSIIQYSIHRLSSSSRLYVDINIARADGTSFAIRRRFVPEIENAPGMPRGCDATVFVPLAAITLFRKRS